MRIICQECAIKILKDESNSGTNKDGTLNRNYCNACLNNGQHIKSFIYKIGIGKGGIEYGPKTIIFALLPFILIGLATIGVISTGSGFHYNIIYYIALLVSFACAFAVVIPLIMKSVKLNESPFFKYVAFCIFIIYIVMNLGIF